MSTTAHLALYPRDGFFCKDGRGWHGGGGGTGRGLDWPWPSTVRGALRTLWGRVHEPIIASQGWVEATDAISLGPTLAMWRERGVGTLERRWPVPADVEYVRPSDGSPSVARLLRPARSTIATLGRDDDQARESLWIAPAIARGKPVLPPRWWTEGELVTWLTEGVISGAPAVAIDRPARRRVTRVAVNPSLQTAADGALFSHDVVETVELDGEWAIAAEVTSLDGRFAATATLGADRRLARVDTIASTAFAPPPALASLGAMGMPGLRLLMVTPTIFERGWIPDGLVDRGGEYRGYLAGLGPEVVLRAVIAPRPVAISGWDMAARASPAASMSGRAAGATGAPRRTDLAVPPGSVYFFQRVDGAGFAEADLGGMWLVALGRRRIDGFGRVLAAPWTIGGGSMP